mmetsp:Transcript_102489/g.182080  ORF Transcript_102489/g.182080 Transcript_102489/m.182080 type:complete len:589 (-) Transcript_102489:158-1924(-)
MELRIDTLSTPPASPASLRKSHKADLLKVITNRTPIRNSPQRAPKSNTGEVTTYRHHISQLFGLYDLRGDGLIQEDAFLNTQRLVQRILKAEAVAEAVPASPSGRFSPMSVNKSPMQVHRSNSGALELSLPSGFQFHLNQVPGRPERLSRTSSLSSIEADLKGPEPRRSPSFILYGEGKFSDVASEGAYSVSKDAFMRWQQSLLDSSLKSFIVKRTRLEWLVKELTKLDEMDGRTKAWREREAASRVLQSQVEAAERLKSVGQAAEAVAALEAAIRQVDAAVLQEAVQIGAKAPQSLVLKVQALRQRLEVWRMELLKAESVDPDLFASPRSEDARTPVRRKSSMGTLAEMAEEEQRLLSEGMAASRKRGADAAQAEAATLGGAQEMLANKAAEVEKHIAKMQGDASTVQAEIEVDLHNTQANLQAAGKEVHELVQRKEDIQELSHMQGPPNPVMVLAQALCILFQEKPHVRVEAGKRFHDYWSCAVDLLDSPELLDKFQTIETYGIPEQIVQRLLPYLEDKDFQLEQQQRCSSAGYTFSLWIHAAVAHQEAALKIDPKRQKLKQLRDELEAAKAALQVWQKALQDAAA